MKTRLHIITIIVLVLGTMIVFISSCKQATEGEIKVVSPEEMKSLLEMDDVQLVDVRTEKEHNSGYIEKSQNIDFRSPDFDGQIAKLDKNRPVLVYCQAGGRSAKCATKLKDAGFIKIYDLSGGITKWKYSGYTVKTKS